MTKLLTSVKVSKRILYFMVFASFLLFFADRYGLFALFARSAVAEQLFKDGAQEPRRFPNNHFHRGILLPLPVVFLAPSLCGKGMFCENIGCLWKPDQGFARARLAMAARRTVLSFSCVRQASAFSSGTHSTSAISPSRGVISCCSVRVRK